MTLTKTTLKNLKKYSPLISIVPLNALKSLWLPLEENVTQFWFEISIETIFLSERAYYFEVWFEVIKHIRYRHFS